jgi:hypothetical protein
MNMKLYFQMHYLLNIKNISSMLSQVELIQSYTIQNDRKQNYVLIKCDNHL